MKPTMMQVKIVTPRATSQTCILVIWGASVRLLAEMREIEVVCLRLLEI